MPKTLVLDVESQRLFQDVGSRDRTDILGVACAVVYDYEASRFRTYDHTEIADLRATLLSADLVVGYTLEKFDLPVIWGIANSQMPRELVGKTYDLYRKICINAGRNPNVGNKGFGLGPICEATLGRGKIDSGKDAPEMWRTGQWGRLFRYCLDDVHLTKDLYDHVIKEGWIKGPKGLRVEFQCQRKEQMPSAAGLTSQI